jgi:hypothetical protein
MKISKQLIVFPSKQVLDSLYRDTFPKKRVIAFTNSKDIILRSSFINLVRLYYIRFFK